MPSKDKSTAPAKPKQIAERIAEREPYDETKTRRAGKRAAEAADRLLKEMDDVLRNLGRKG